MRIENNVFLIAGGGSGFGEIAARLLSGLGGKIVIMDLDEEKANAVAKETGALFIQADVVSEEGVKRAVKTAVDINGALHGVVNCAEISSMKRVIGKNGLFPLEIFNKVLQVNLIGTFNVLRIAALAMAECEPNAEGERGVIINTASMAAYEGKIGHAAYAAAKAGVGGMTLPIARELAEFGIRVSTVAPGLYDAPLWETDPKGKTSSAWTGRTCEFARLIKSIIENPMLNGETIRLGGTLRLPSITL